MTANFDEGMRAFIRRAEQAFPPDYRDYPLPRQREMYRALCAEFERPRPAEVTVTDGVVSGETGNVPIRIYRPKGDAPQPCLLYMHGGGFVFGDLDSHDGVSAEIADRAEVTVIAVHYRLAPEHRYPAAFEDSRAVLKHIAAAPERFGVDRARLGVGGDSAGGNLAAALALWARAHGGPTLRAQVLIYPGLGLGMTDQGRPAGGDAPLLAKDELDYYARAYLGPSGRTTDPYAAPLLAEDFSGLPPAFVQAVEHDPIRPDAEAYAACLEAAGVPVDFEVAAGLVHGCLRARFVSEDAARAFERICAATHRLLV